MLVLGFALHNGTEGFGIVGAAGQTRVSAADAVLLGLVAGGPACLGAVLSGQALSSYFTIGFYALAAGSLLYVLLSLTAMSDTATRRIEVASGLFAGLSLMYVTSMVLTLLGRLRT